MISDTSRQRRSVLIVFADEWLAYSPSATNLHDELAKTFDVTILTFRSAFCDQSFPRPSVHYVSLSEKAQGWLSRLESILPRVVGRLHLRAWAKAIRLRSLLMRYQADNVISVDSLATWAAQSAFASDSARVHMLSLELNDRDPFMRLIHKDRLSSVIIQTPERFTYLFPDSAITPLYVQNAPVYRAVSHRYPRPTNQLLYCGTATPRFGIRAALDFIRRYPDFTITVHGLCNADTTRHLTEYADLTAAGRLILSTKYLEIDDLLDFIRHFRLGFCIYDLSELKRNRFNYETAPSGKLFNYYAAGVPVIGLDIPGLSSVREFQTGVLVKQATPEAIRAAVREIEQDYDRYSANCVLAAQHFSFDVAIQPFIDRLRLSAAAASK